MTPDPPALGPYRIVRRVGAGGMGVVFEAVHTGLEKRVALKVLPRELVAHRLDRFLREARTAAALHHTNIVPVFDVGQVDGVPYYAMQFIDGKPLDRLNEKELATRTADPPAGVPEPTTRTLPPEVEGTKTLVPPGTTGDLPREENREDSRGLTPARQDAPKANVAHVVALVLQAAEGLAYAHARGVVHRDIKPSNLLLDSAGVVWVADFGLAFRQDDPALTTDGAVLGTPRYMSPEQARAEKTDPRTDVYSLGVTLYELLTGTAAFAGETPLKVIQQVLAHVPPRPRALNRAIPRDLETVVLKAMAKRSEDRYANGREFADDLRRFLAGEPVRARRITAVGRAWRWAKRNPAVASLLTMVLVVFAAGAGVASYFADRASEREKQAKAHSDTANEILVQLGHTVSDLNIQKAIADDAARENRRLLYAARMSLASVALNEGRYERVAELLRDTFPKAGEEDPRGWEWHYLFRTVFSASAERRLPQQGSGNWLFDANRLVRIEEDEDGVRCQVFDPATGRHVRTTEGKVPVPALQVQLPDVRVGDTRRFLFRSKGEVCVWDVDAGKEVVRLPLPARTGALDAFNAPQAALSPDGTRYARVIADPATPKTGEKAAVELMDAATRKRAHLLPGPNDFGEAEEERVVKFSPDGRWVGAMDRSGRCTVWDAAAGKLRLAHRPEGEPTFTDPQFAFRGDRLAVLLPDDRTIECHDLGGKARPVRVAAPAQVLAFDFDHTGERLAVADMGRTVRVFDLTDRAPMRVFRFASPVLKGVVFAADGKKLLGFGQGNWDQEAPEILDLVREWDLERPAHRRVPRASFRVGTDQSAAFSPDGARLMIGSIPPGSSTNRYTVWDADTLVLCNSHNGFQTERCAPAWAPDGSRYAVTGEVPELRALVPPLGPVPAPLLRPVWEKSPAPVVSVHDARTGRRLDAVWPLPAPLKSLQFSPCGHYLAVNHEEGIEVRDLRSARTVRVPLRPPDGPKPDSDANFLANPTRLAVVRDTPAGAAVELHDPATGAGLGATTVRGLYRGHTIRPSPDGRWLALRVRDAERGLLRVAVVGVAGPRPEVVATFERPGTTDYGFGDRLFWAGRWLAAAGDRVVRLYETGTWKPGPVLVGDDEVLAVNLTADGRRLLVYENAPQVPRLSVWDVASGQRVLTVPTGERFGDYAVPHLGGDRYTFHRKGPRDELELDTFDGSPVPDALARERLGLK